MTGFNFKKHVKLYIVYGANQYNIDISEISFSQTFTEESYAVKTLNDQSLMFEGSVINKANPANFNFDLPVIVEPDLQILMDLVLDYDLNNTKYRKMLKTFDLYIETQLDVFKLEYCAIESCSFQIEKFKPLALSINGQASKLTKVGDFGNYIIPGLPQPKTTNPTYVPLRDLVVIIGGVDIPKSVYNISVELQNKISWIPYRTVNQAINAVDAATSMYPTQLTLESRILSGSIGVYIGRDSYTDIQDQVIDTSLRIKVGKTIAGTLYGFDFNMSNCSFTNRISVSDVFSQSYDWRMVQNPEALSSVISYITT